MSMKIFVLSNFHSFRTANNRIEMKTLIQTPTPKLEDSLAFYTKLGFETLSQKRSAIVTDGKAIIEINPELTARCGVKLYSSDWQKTLAMLENEYPLKRMESGYLLGDPSGVWVYLVEGEGIGAQVSGNPSSVLGNFAGLSIETLAIDKSQEMWQILGFEPVAGDADEGWISLSNNELTVSLMAPLACPHLFFNPSLTFFNGEKNLSVIKTVKKLGIPITEEITCFNEEGVVDNIIIRDPGGLGAFLFND